MNPSPYRAPFTSAHGRARIVKILLIVGAVVTGLSLLAQALSLAFPPITEDQELSDNPVGAAVILIMFLLALIDALVYLTTVVFFLVWLYRSHNNLRAFYPSRRLDYSAGWAVGSFFIPFVNLVVPYRAVREVWQKSGPPEEGLLAEPNPPAWFALWWLFWILSSISNNISLRVTFNESVPERTATLISIVASALTLTAALLAYMVVDLIDRRQENTSARLSLGTFSGPPPPPAELRPSSTSTPSYVGHDQVVSNN